MRTFGTATAATSPSPTLQIAAAAFALLLTAPCVALAATITVNSTEDLVADDGRCTLREAINAVNSQTASGGSSFECPAGDGSDTIVLPKGFYQITRAGAGEDLNDTGDLDIARSVTISGDGSGSKIGNGIGDAKVLGDGDRIFHIDPLGAGGVDVILSGLQIRNGDASCSTAACNPGAGAVEASLGRHLTIENCLFTLNTTSCVGDLCGDGDAAGAVAHGELGDLTITDTVFKKNFSTCFGIECSTGAAALNKLDNPALGTATTTLTNVSLVANRTYCESSSCEAYETLYIEGGSAAVTNFEASANRTECVATECFAWPVVSVFSAGASSI